MKSLRLYITDDGDSYGFYDWHELIIEVRLCCMLVNDTANPIWKALLSKPTSLVLEATAQITLSIAAPVVVSPD